MSTIAQACPPERTEAGNRGRAASHWIMLRVWNEIRPGSEVVDCLHHLESEALRVVEEIRAWRRSDGSGEMEPVDIILRAFLWGDRWFEEKIEILGRDRTVRLQWRGLFKEWWSKSRIATRTAEEAVRAWLQISENAAYEIARIENTRSFAVALSSAAVAIVALVIAGCSLIAQLFKS